MRKASSEQTRETSLGSVPAATGPLTGSGWSFDGVLRRVVGFSRAAENEGVALDALGLFVRTLDQATHDKLETVMRAGRDGRALADAHVLLSQERVMPGYKPPDLFGEGEAALQNLQRGHAVACATGFDLERDLQGSPAAEGRSSLDERVWLRFGRELALSNPGDWSCLALVNARKELLMVFMRLGEKRWWSFDSMIDRPSTRQMARRRNARASKRGRLVSLSPEALVERRCRVGRKAVRRAALAMSARLGRCRVPSNDSDKAK
jgi:hypothetical protein